ncbi:MAG: PglZ domain-containing protein [Lutibacter sp.]|nr:PglZ domain-containing protein [Lutibacter sp.]
MIREYIVTHLQKKLNTNKVLVIYDAVQFYAELLPALSKIAKVIDLRNSILEAREEAYHYFNNDLVNNTEKGLVIYSPFEAPLNEQDKIEDPFYIFTLGNNYFPYSASDKYETLCKACFSEKESQINELFAQSIPDFDTIDALGDGNIYAKLQVLTGCKSEKELFLALMTPNDSQEAKLKSDKTWFSEYKKLTEAIGLNSKANKTFENVNEELWRIILFSEFVFDLPIALPQKLQSVPIVKESSKSLVLDIVKTIRNNKASEQIYIDKANEIEKQLGLSKEFKNEINLGSIVTFAFEDNTYFNHFISLITQNEFKKAEEVKKQNKENIWPQQDEERKKMWLLADYALKICQLTSSKDKFPAAAKAIVDLYANQLFEIDLYQRRFEMTISQIISSNQSIDLLVTKIRTIYREYIGKLQKAFYASFNSWPIEGMNRNIQLFDKYITPELKGKKKIAYLLVDALRFEIGKELEQSLSNHFTINITPSCAFVPTVTKYAMAALVPNAEKALSLNEHGGKLEAFLDGKPALNLESRRTYFKEKLGDRCEIITLDQLLNNHQSTPDLLIITTNEIDGAGENLNITTALASMQQSIHNLSKGLFALKKLGYEKTVIATDHGFMLYPTFLHGDSVKKPQGEWILQKGRCIAGKGIISENSLSFNPSGIGVNSNVENFQFLKNYAVFEKNLQFFHEGISLQEAIVPIIEIATNNFNTQKEAEITLTYRGKSEGSVTTRRPLIELMCFQEGNIGFDPITIKIEAVSGNNIIGEPIESEEVNSLTKLVEIFPQRAYKIPLGLLDEFEGKFKVIASDPLSGKEFSVINLETNYLD